MLALPLALALAVTPFDAHYLMRLGDTPVGRVRLELSQGSAGRLELRYHSESLVRRGPVLSRLETTALATLDSSFSVDQLAGRRVEGGVVASTVSASRVEGGLRIESTLAGTPPASRVDPIRRAPSALAPLLLSGARPRCLPVVEELTGRVGEACGSTSGTKVAGTILGEPFEARVVDGRLVELSFPRQDSAFERVPEQPSLLAPPDLFGAPVIPVGWHDRPVRQASFELRVGARLVLPASASQLAEPRSDGARLRWTHARPGERQALTPGVPQGEILDELARRARGEANERWTVARSLTRFVALSVADKRPAKNERDARAVAESGRASCRGHVELFLALARSSGLPARPAIGLAGEGGRFWGHAWAQVEVGGRWYDVDPTSGEAPPGSPYLLLATPSTPAEELEAGRLLAAARQMELRAVER